MILEHRALTTAVTRYWQNRPTLRCGTDRGYEYHRFRGQTPCQPCRKAHAMVVSIRRRRVGA